MDSRKIKIAIDAHAIGHNPAGNGIYTYNLVCCMVREFKQHEWILYLTEAGKDSMPEDVVKTASVRILKSGNPFTRYFIELPRFLKEDRPDILHTQYWGPFRSKCPNVVMVHDISFNRVPQYFTFAERTVMNILIPYFMKKARKVLTVSDHAREEIIDRYDMEEGKVITTYNGVDRNIFYPCEENTGNVLKKYGIDGPYLLFVGSLQPRKNIEGLLRAFATEISHIYPLLKVVIAGPDGWLSGGIGKILEEYPVLKEKVIFTGRINDGELRVLYCKSRAVTYIPFYEGFGLPVLEAMACGVPVITSNVTSLPEVGGNAVRMVDPNDINAIGEAISDIYSNDALREIMVQRGLSRAERFTWNRTAVDTVQVLEGVVHKDERYKAVRDNSKL